MLRLIIIAVISGAFFGASLGTGPVLAQTLTRTPGANSNLLNGQEVLGLDLVYRSTLATMDKTGALTSLPSATVTVQDTAGGVRYRMSGWGPSLDIYFDKASRQLMPAPQSQPAIGTASDSVKVSGLDMRAVSLSYQAQLQGMVRSALPISALLAGSFGVEEFADLDDPLTTPGYVVKYVPSIPDAVGSRGCKPIHNFLVLAKTWQVHVISPVC